MSQILECRAAASQLKIEQQTKKSSMGFGTIEIDPVDC